MSPPSLPFRWTLPLGGPRGRRTGRDAANGRASGKHSLIEIMPVCIALVVGAITDRSLIRASSPGGGLLRPTAKEWLWVGALLGLTALAVWVTGFYERWLFWRTHEERALTMLSATVVALLLLVESFTAISAILVQEGKVAASGMFYQLSDAAQKRAEEQAALKGGSTSKFLFPSDADLYQEMERFYFWKLLDAVPAVKIPETLNWDKPAVELTDKLGGSLVLVFKILVVLPVVRVGVQLWKRSQADGERSP